MRDPMRNPRLLRSHYPPCPDCGIRLKFSQDPASRMAECYHCDKIFDPVKVMQWKLYGRQTWKTEVWDWMGGAWFLLSLPCILIFRLPYLLIVKSWRARQDIRTVKFLRPLSWKASTRNTIFVEFGGTLAVIGAIAFIKWMSTWGN